MQAVALNTQVLVLNKLWMALRVVTAQRAFSMLYRDLAEVIDVDDAAYAGYDFDTWAAIGLNRAQFNGASYDWVKTVRFDLAVPKVIRLFGYDRLPRQEIKLNRRNIFARDRSICQYCGKRCPTSELSLDHVVPRSQGGCSSWGNLVCCCVACNARKGGRTPSQAGMVLVRQPVKPRRHSVVSLRVESDRYACWQQFLDNAYWSVELK